MASASPSLAPCLPPGAGTFSLCVPHPAMSPFYRTGMGSAVDPPLSPCLDFILGGSCRTVSIWEESCPRAVGVRRGVSFQGGNRQSPRRCREPLSTAAPRSHPSGRGEGRGFGGQIQRKKKRKNKKKPQFANCQIGVVNSNHLLRCSVQEAAGHSPCGHHQPPPGWAPGACRKVV